MSETFDGILFENDNELINFLKHSYFANRTQIKTLENDYQKLKELWLEYFEARDKGIIQSSDHNGTWNIEQKARALLGKQIH